MSPKPTARGLFLCEQVIVEEGTRNVTVVNSFHHLDVRQFPSEPRSCVLFAYLEGGVGEVTVEAVFYRLDTFQALRRLGGQLRFQDRLLPHRCTIRMRELTFPVEGADQFSLLADTENSAQAR